jgi:hypothetical protein
MGAADSRSFRSDTSVRMHHFVLRNTSTPFRRFLRDVRREFCNVFLLLFMVLWVPISVMLCKKAALMLWHAFMFLGLGFFPLLFLSSWWPPLIFSYKKIIIFNFSMIIIILSKNNSEYKTSSS